MESKNVEIPAKFKDLVEKIESMSVLDLSELVHLLEEKFGVTAQAPMMMAGGPAAGGAEAGAAAEEKTSFDLHLTSAGEQKVQVIKVLKDALGLGLKEAKDLSDQAPVKIKEGMKKEEAADLKKKLEDAGAKVELK